jgi:hypothetical protein
VFVEVKVAVAVGVAEARGVGVGKPGQFSQILVVVTRWCGFGYSTEATAELSISEPHIPPFAKLSLVTVNTIFSPALRRVSVQRIPSGDE